MVRFYAMQIKLKKMTIEEVPDMWREEVKQFLKEEN